MTAAAPLPEKPPVRFEAGREWRLLGTYNAVDAARVFRFGQALGRRFVRVPIPPMSVEEFETALTPQTEKLPGKVLVSLVALYKAHLSVEAALLGPGVFFRAVGYVRNGLALKGLAEIEDEGDGADEQMEGAPASQPAIDALIAEAYLLAAGAWLARLERAELDLLRAAIPTTVLDEDQWTWLTRLLRALA